MPIKAHKQRPDKQVRDEKGKYEMKSKIKHNGGYSVKVKKTASA